MVIPLGLGLKPKRFPIASVLITLSCIGMFMIQPQIIVKPQELFSPVLRKKILTQKVRLFKNYCLKHYGKANCQQAELAYAKKISPAYINDGFHFDPSELMSTPLKQIKENNKTEPRDAKASKNRPYKIIREFERNLKTKNSKLKGLPGFSEYLEAKEKEREYLFQQHKENDLYTKKNNGLITNFKAQFYHGSAGHLFGNMLGLIVFGIFVEMRLGVLKFLALYLSGGTFSLFLFNTFSMGEEIFLVGASGNVYAIMGAFYIFFYKHYLKLGIIAIWALHFTSVLVPVRKYFPFFFIIPEVVGHFGSFGGVAHMAHVWGLLFGIGTAFYQIKNERFKWPFIFQYEWDTYQRAMKTKKAKSQVTLLKATLDMNPANTVARNKLFILIIQLINKTEATKQQKAMSFLKDNLKYTTNKIVGSKSHHQKYQQAIEIIKRIPTSFDLNEILDHNYTQKQIISLGDQACKSAEYITSVRLYLVYLIRFPKAKLSEKIEQSIRDIIDYSKQNYEWVELADAIKTGEISEFTIRTADYIENQIERIA